MAKDFSEMELSNESGNPSIHGQSELSRRVVISGGLAAWKLDGSNSAADQAVQMGMHHDGLHFYALGKVSGSDRGLLVMNHEYVDDGLLHTDGIKTWSAEKVLKAQAAHGISVVEVELKNNVWSMVRPSKYARRFTTNTPFALSGPAAGHAMMKTAADPQGRMVAGTLNNCASGKTPWGTYLSGEENWAFYFDGGKNLDAHQKRWGLREKGFYRWPEFDARFDVVKTPNEPNRFGWVVEVDPMDPTSTPIKRTALGRAAHEGAWVSITKDKRAPLIAKSRAPRGVTMDAPCLSTFSTLARQPQIAAIPSSPINSLTGQAASKAQDRVRQRWLSVKMMAELLARKDRRVSSRSDLRQRFVRAKLHSSHHNFYLIRSTS